jgi:hypothetical protein
MRRRQLNQPQCFSSGPSQLPNEGPAKSTATRSLKNSARQPLAELATRGAGQDSAPGQAVPCQPARTPLTSNTVAPLSRRKNGRGHRKYCISSFRQTIPNLSTVPILEEGEGGLNQDAAR